MKLILDSNVALKLVLPEVDTAAEIQLHDDFNAGIHELLAPNIFPVEVAHALTRAERQGRIADPWKLWQLVMSDCPQLFETDPLMQRAVEISSTARIGVYDCLYVALAEQEGCDLVTADLKLVKNLPSRPIIAQEASQSYAPGSWSPSSRSCRGVLAANTSGWNRHSRYGAKC